MNDWKISIHHISSRPLESPLHPQPGPMSKEDIQKVMDKFDNTLKQLGDYNVND